MVNVRAHRSSYDAWAADGAPGWGYHNLLPFFRRTERTRGRDFRYRGDSGPMTPATITMIHPAARACFEAFKEMGYPVSPDLNGADQEGVEFTELTVVDGGLREYLRRATGTYWHPVGTCRMGTDEGAVTDIELRVRGLAGLRVADASVMPSVPAANTNATVLAIAERAASLITEGAGVPARIGTGASIR